MQTLGEDKLTAKLKYKQCKQLCRDGGYNEVIEKVSMDERTDDDRFYLLKLIGLLRNMYANRESTLLQSRFTALQQMYQDKKLSKQLLGSMD